MPEWYANTYAYTRLAGHIDDTAYVVMKVHNSGMERPHAPERLSVESIYRLGHDRLSAMIREENEEYKR